MALFGLLNYISMALRGHKTTINTAENICSPVDVHFYAAVFQSKDSICTVLSGGIQNNLVSSKARNQFFASFSVNNLVEFLEGKVDFMKSI